MLKDVITIQCADFEAGICPRLGGNVVYLRYRGKNILRPLTEESQLAVNPYLQGAPILMPANRTHRGKFVFEGVEYTLPLNEPHNNAHLHGLVHRQKFTVLSEEVKRVRLEYLDEEGVTYPFAYRMTVEYALDEKGLLSTYLIENLSGQNMPLTFALHTTFMEPELFSVPISACQEKDKYQIPTGRYIALNGQEKSLPTGTESRGKEFSGYYKGNGQVARIGEYLYTVSENFDHWILYNGEGEQGFLCAEPQSGAVNGLNIEGRRRVLPPDGDIVFKTKIGIG